MQALSRMQLQTILLHTARKKKSPMTPIFDTSVFSLVRYYITIPLTYSSPSRHFGLQNFRRPISCGVTRINSELPSPTDSSTPSVKIILKPEHASLTDSTSLKHCLLRRLSTLFKGPVVTGFSQTLHADRSILIADTLPVSGRNFFLLPTNFPFSCRSVKFVSVLLEPLLPP